MGIGASSGVGRRRPRRLRGPSFAILLLCLLPCAIQAPRIEAQEDTELLEEAVSSAPVVIDGEELFRVRGVSAFPAEQRAQQIADAIRSAARDSTVDPQALTTEASDGRTVISIGGRRMMAVLDADAQLEQIDRATLAASIGQRIQRSIVGYREGRSRRNLLNGAGIALGATLLLAVLIFVLLWASRRIGAAVERRMEQRIRKLEARSSYIVQAKQLATLFRGVGRAVRLLVVLALVYAYLSGVLSLFPWTRDIAASLFEHVLEPLRLLAVGFLDYIPELIFLVIFGFLVRGLLRLLRLLFEALERGSLQWHGFEREWSAPTYRLVRILMVAFSIVVAYPYIPGSDSAAFKGMSIFLGVLVSLGSTSLVSNIVAGQTLIYRRAFKVGDRVKVAGILGDVMEIRAMGTRLRTPKNEVVVVPNSTLLGGEIINYSMLTQTEGLILHTSVGIGYEVPWRQVEAILLQAAHRTAGVMSEPSPFVLQTALGDFAVVYELNVHCDDATRMAPLYSDLHRNILDVFNEYGIQIMTPAYEGDPAEPKVVPPDKWHTPPAGAASG